MALCDKCRKLDIDKILQEGVLLHQNWELLVKSAQSCRICAFAVSQQQAHLKAQYYAAVSKRLSEVSTALDYRLVSSLREVDPLGNAEWYKGHDMSTVLEGFVGFTEQLTLRLTFGAKNVQIHGAPTWEWDRDKFVLKNTCSTYDLPYFTYINQPFLDGYQPVISRAIPPTHQEAFAWARDTWYGCVYHHAACQPSKSSKGLPRRLLSLAELETGIVSVVSTAYIEIVGYATLSYCWGDTDSREWLEYLHKIQTSSLVFECSRLPVTIQDAITVASSLGLEYLWVDALCILQHSTHDWEEEGSRMNSIYSGCAIMISASNSIGSDQGFLQHRAPSDTCTVKVELQIGDIAFEVQVESESMGYAQDVSLGPVTSRAWCLQEQWLAPRVLHFGKQQLHYECAFERWQEREPEDHLISATDVGRQGERASTYSDEPVVKRPLSKVTGAPQWNMIIQEYTKRRLRHGSDKLIALSGLASKASESLQCNYLAGVFQEALHIGLSWYVAPICIAIDSDTVLLSQQAHELGMGRATQYRAPSWSWASMDGPVTFLVTSDIEARGITSSIEFTEAAIQHTSSSQFGPVATAQLMISGALKNIPADSFVANIRLEQHNVINDSAVRIGWYIADEGEMMTGDLVCLKLATRSYDSLEGIKTECIVLVLEELGSGNYTRRGVGMVFRADYFDDAAISTVTLV